MSVSLSVNTFELKYLRNQHTNPDQILSHASLESGKQCVRFLGRSIKNSGFHGYIYIYCSHKVEDIRTLNSAAFTKTR